MKIVLIGDSVRLGYQPLVAKRLEGKAVVWGPDRNCRHSLWILDHFQNWVLDQKPDILHLNCGIHDAAEDIFPDGEPQIPLETYKLNVARIVQKVKNSLPDTTLIWATTTPRFLYAYEPRFLPIEKWKAKKNIDRYNNCASQIMQDNGIVIDDLHGVIMKNDFSKCILREDGLHMTEFGNTVLAEAVIEAITP